MDSILTQVAEVTPDLFLCAATAVTMENLRSRNITLVINATRELPLFPQEDDIENVRVGVLDSQQSDILPYFQV